MKNILVTGATGFLGQALCRQLLEEGYNVKACIRNNKPVDGCEPITIGNLSDKTNWLEILSDIDCVIHLAARVHMMNDTDEDAYRQINVNATRHLAQEAQKSGVKRFIFLSSIKVNGEETKVNQPFKTTDVPNPVDPYGASKFEAENILNGLDIETTIIRPPLVYGPGVKANFQALMKLANKSIPVPFGSLKNIRSLIYVENLAHIITCCINNHSTGNKTYLVRDNQEVSFSELYCKLSHLMGKPTWMLPVPLFILKLIGKLIGKDQTIHRLITPLQVDHSQIVEDLDWQAPFSLEEGLIETIKWFKTQQNS